MNLPKLSIHHNQSMVINNFDLKEFTRDIVIIVIYTLNCRNKIKNKNKNLIK